MSWTPFFEEKLNDCRLMSGAGGTIEDVVEYLHDGGLSVVELVRVIARLPAMNFADAKRAVVTHPVWTEVAEATSLAWDDVLLILEREGKVTKLDDDTIVYQERLTPAVSVAETPDASAEPTRAPA